MTIISVFNKMAILHSCCCWRSVRKGSFASGIYTLLYYSLNAGVVSKSLHEDILYLRSNFTEEPQYSIIDPDTTSETSLVFSFVILTVTSCGIVASLILFYGLYKDKRYLLIPWVVTLAVCIVADLSQCIYSFVKYTLKINPQSAILFTFDFFIVTLNVYALLCVISQYQELKCGRGRACDDADVRIPSIHFSTQATATTFTVSRKPATYFHEGKATTVHNSSTAAPSSVGTDESSPCTKVQRKSVKFDQASQLLEPWSMETKNVSRGIDTAPLIDSRRPSQPSV
ncbi:uncharacterized protein LOC108741058 [Agrilus planipennis]|uniref:Uncharacterized protein LOC108741058 n=1 Tax=Agrilus planipennis TaxID=224129 RepID=A0A1W4X522_AGRPL|nr:uncharacterized protein LOC108741058 [Agrilus planipennis]XP_018331173.1 uncharacterized protein LOC108741058 [Agrilus planipennis]XP_018331174.1 uncharacterized protein LOC108741058 [Agrilus planipennis]XP_018331176.1 uncharacterized protein LOC108741058 [Agrilus planipennis]